MELFFNKNKIEAGCDEAGRGCLAGPVVAASVILPKTIEIPNLRDSKKLSPKQRKKLVPIIKEKAISFSIAFVNAAEIDKINILKASILAMHIAVGQLETKPELLIIDGNRFIPYKNIPHHCIIKGDDKYLSIAAASVLAKEARDDFMLEMHKNFPHYAWDKNKGYPTKAHRLAIKNFGISPYHRKTFRLLAEEQQVLF